MWMWMYIGVVQASSPPSMMSNEMRCAMGSASPMICHTVGRGEAAGGSFKVVIQPHDDHLQCQCHVATD